VTAVHGRPFPVLPAIGGGGRLPRKALVWQGVTAFALVVLLIIAKQVVTAREVGPDPLTALPGGKTVAAGLSIGGVPADYELQALSASYHVDGVVNLSGPSVAEQVTAASLRLGYLLLDVPPGAAPTLPQLQGLAVFLRAHTMNGALVYLHDDVGGGRAVVTASMLLLLRGSSWATVRHEITAAELGSLSQPQLRAVRQLISALGGQPQPGNPYASARVDPW
jgi:hypothetical protein